MRIPKVELFGPACAGTFTLLPGVVPVFRHCTFSLSSLLTTPKVVQFGIFSLHSTQGGPAWNIPTLGAKRTVILVFIC